MALRPAPPGTIVLMSRAWGVLDHCGHGPVALKHWLLPNGTALVRVTTVAAPYLCATGGYTIAPERYQAADLADD